MGYIRHHAIVVTAYRADIHLYHQKAESIFPDVSPISSETINGYRSFFIPPDGSKEGWEESNTGDDNRRLFIQFLKQYPGAGWVEVQYHDDDRISKVTQSSDDWRDE